MTHSIEVHRAKTRDLITALFLAALASGLLWVLLSGGIDSAKDASTPAVRFFGNHPLLAKSMLGITSLICLLGTLAMIRNYRDQTPGFIADAKGVVDAHYDPAEAIGPVPWSEIKGFKLVGKRGKQTLVVQLLHPHDHLATGNENRQRNSARFMEAFGSPVVIPEGSLRIDLARLHAACIDMHSKHGTPGQGSSKT